MDAQQQLPDPPLEATLIRRARQARGLTMAQAAERSSIVKASRWGQIENGYLMKGGQPISAKAGDMQLAHMARAVGLSPDRLAEVAREGAAEILREIERQESEQDKGGYTDPQEQAVWEMTRLTEEDRREMIHLLRLGREARRRLG